MNMREYINEDAYVVDKADKPLNKPFRLPKGSSKKFGVYVKDGDRTVKVTLVILTWKSVGMMQRHELTFVVVILAIQQQTRHQHVTGLVVCGKEALLCQN